jgi:hypothetical protein
MQTHHFDESGHGIFMKTYHGLGVNRDSTVLASASEMHFADGLVRPFIGDAFVQVISIAPQDNGNVDVKIHVDFNSDLLYRVALVVV